VSVVVIGDIRSLLVSLSGKKNSAHDVAGCDDDDDNDEDEEKTS
jgi:hypothetical protein